LEGDVVFSERGGGSWRFGVEVEGGGGAGRVSFVRQKLLEVVSDGGFGAEGRRDVADQNGTIPPTEGFGRDGWVEFGGEFVGGGRVRLIPLRLVSEKTTKFVASNSEGTKPNPSDVGEPGEDDEPDEDDMDGEEVESGGTLDKRREGGSFDRGCRNSRGGVVEVDSEQDGEGDAEVTGDPEPCGTAGSGKGEKGKEHENENAHVPRRNRR